MFIQAKIVKILMTIFLGIALLTGSAQERLITGIVCDSSGKGCAYCNLHFVSKNGFSKSCIAREDGVFQIKLPLEKYEVYARLIGYVDTVYNLNISSREFKQIRWTMEEKSNEKGEVIIHAEPEDIAKRALRQAIKNRRRYLKEDTTIHYQSYRKLSLTETKPDTAEAGMDSVWLATKKRKRPEKTYQAYLSESYSSIQFAHTNQYSELVDGQLDHTNRKPREELEINFSFNYGEKEIARQDPGYDNNFILRSTNGYQDFSIYQRLLHLPSIAEKPILSPIGDGALLSYKPSLLYSYLIDSIEVLVVHVEPYLTNEPLLRGDLHILTSNWTVIKSNLNFAADVSPVFKGIEIQQEYSFEQQNVFMSNCRIDYSAKAGRSKFNGSINIHNTLNENNFHTQLKGATKCIPDSAYYRNEDYWQNVRTQSLNKLEKQYAKSCDSLQQLYRSADYMAQQDSISNHISWMDLLVYGITWRTREKQRLLFLYPLTMQLNFAGVGGYRHKIGGVCVKELPNTWQLETRAELDYGFRNQDLRGKFGIGLTYFPLKFVRTFVQVGDYYEMINSYASISSILNRSNFVRTKSISMAQRMEIFNGFYAEVTTEYSLQQPILGLQQDRWSADVFGDNNQPINFDNYAKTELRFDLNYRIRQKYSIKKGKKIILGSDYPMLKSNVRFGLPNVWGSQVNFGYAELGAYHDLNIGRIGLLQWSILGGGFFNQQNLRIVEHRYFRGSDPFLFSDPLKSFQLLGPTLSTSDIFFRANCFHHFNGLVLNKIPLIAKLKITEAAGIGFLSIPSQKLAHSEAYMGIEKIIRIRKELFRIGVYGCTSLSSGQGMRLEWKAGINFYNSYSKRWQY